MVGRWAGDGDSDLAFILLPHLEAGSELRDLERWSPGWLVSGLEQDRGSSFSQLALGPTDLLLTSPLGAAQGQRVEEGKLRHSKGKQLLGLWVPRAPGSEQGGVVVGP